jgi:hypothetical protein
MTSFSDHGARDRKNPAPEYRSESMLRPTGRSVADNGRIPSWELELHLKEYEKLKDEQISRIGFRDNLIYVTIATVGAVLSYALQSPEKYPAFLVLPPLCFALGWTYVTNYEKVTAIGDYLRDTLSQVFTSILTGAVFRWEEDHRLGKARRFRKVVQLLVDQVLFCGSGVGAIVAYLVLVDRPPLELQFLALIEAALVLLLSSQILRYAAVGVPNRYEMVGRGARTTKSRDAA